ncbi:hypothetical protein RFI_33430 [Reticulomyxa filosa]|uniref:Uncharacterized protein n=1 Tax=Reticulomyxa filosa TaxID=46433 RepID=X6LS88_RETFI|nr:hypothetical protein RFI_33430 [Reticulomyxa filosa]|eukprot:ETO03972.1 hypothetical protein RFI_33430 [Reticulomyxa filosa]
MSSAMSDPIPLKKVKTSKKMWDMVEAAASAMHNLVSHDGAEKNKQSTEAHIAAEDEKQESQVKSTNPEKKPANTSTKVSSIWVQIRRIVYVPKSVLHPKVGTTKQTQINTKNQEYLKTLLHLPEQHIAIPPVKMPFEQW